MDSTVEYYEKNADVFINNTIYVNMSELYSCFLDIIPVGSHILDAGCGSGRDSKYFIDNGYKVTAFDASRKICDKASAYIGQEVINATFDTFNSTEQFDGIWACASLLHVKRAEMIATVNKLIGSLKPNGVLYASWKYGYEERIQAGKYYCDLDERWIKEILYKINGELVSMWVSHDQRKTVDCKWLNILLRNHR